VFDIVDLVTRAQKGNQAAFIELFHQYETRIYRIAFLYVKNKDDALDAVQETAYRSFKLIASLKQPDHFKTWITKIAIRCSIDILRKRKKVIPLRPDYEEMVFETKEDDIPLFVTLQELIELLDEDEKSVIILRFYQDCTIKDVADILELPVGTAKTVLYRALKKLRKALKGDGVS
jgi:RNA polymerase sigma-70 factor, ECF subfamily